MRLALACFLPAVLWSQTVTGPSIRFHTTLGDIDVTLLPDSAPQTVANFLTYVNSGAYNNSIIHRSVPGFVWQGGGYQLINNAPVLIPQNSPVVNEYKLSNTRGTLAMAQLSGSPNSATDQWFFNLVDNTSTLNSATNGHFVVFGRVASSASLAVMDKIAAQPYYDESTALGDSAFTNLPLVNYSSGTPQASNYILVNSIAQVANTTVLSVNTAGDFGAFPAAAPGSFIEIYGANLAGTSRGWGNSDFVNNNAPTTLDNVSVTIAGQRAYVNYVSPAQVNVQVPGSVSAGTAVPIIVTYNGLSSTPLPIVIKALEPGILAPVGFLVKGTQYAAAIHAANNTFVSNGSISGTAAAPAVAGETLVFYGTGFGPVTQSNAPVAGQVSQGLTTLSAEVRFILGGMSAQVTYAGFAPGLVGVDQFNIVVPAGLASGDQPLQILVNGTPIPQTLSLSVQ